MYKYDKKQHLCMKKYQIMNYIALMKHAARLIHTELMNHI